MQTASLAPHDAIASLRSSAGGLTTIEAGRRLAEYGPNRLEEAKGTPLVLRFLREFAHFFALILWVAAALAFVAEALQPGSGMGTLGVAILGVILVNGSFSFWQEYRAERAVRALKRLLPQWVTAMRGGAACRLTADELVPGDVVLVGEGDSVPADCLLLEAEGLVVSLAALTGESRPRARVPTAGSEEDLLQARNVLLAGTSVVSGQGKALVFTTGMRTEFGKIAGLTQANDDPPSPLQREIARLSRLIALVATGLGVVFFVVGHGLGLTFWANLMFAIGIIVANVPEGLLPTVTLSLAMATQRMARRNALVRHLPAVEALGAATVICTDKTGTLTQNRMEVRRIFHDGMAGPAHANEPCARSAGLAAAALHCHNVRSVIDGSEVTLAGDPMERALLQWAQSSGLPPPRPRLAERAFDTDRRRMSTVHATEAGRTLYCKGAPEAVLPLCNRVVDAAGRTVPLSEEARARQERAVEAMATDGLRVIAFALRELPQGLETADWESELVLAGIVGLDDPPRQEVPAAIAACGMAGIRVIMITGDHPRTAAAIAREIGLGAACEVIAADALRRMSDTHLQLALDTPDVHFARVSAEQKLRIVEALQRKGHIVAVTGDGVNDAPALKRADIGIAMGMIGTDVAREVADVVLLDDNFASIVSAVEEGRTVFRNIRKFLTYILASNVPEIVPYLAFVLFGIPLPLTIIQILAVDLGTDMLPALALGAERPDPSCMKERPRGSGERLLNRGLMARAYLFLGVIEAAAAMAAFFHVMRREGWQWGEMPAAADPGYVRATTACLAAIVVLQVVNVFLCRHPRDSLAATGMQGNPLILWGISAELALLALIVYTPFGNTLFGTAPLGAGVWTFILPFAVAMLVLEEMRKYAARRL